MCDGGSSERGVGEWVDGRRGWKGEKGVGGWEVGGMRECSIPGDAEGKDDVREREWEREREREREWEREWWTWNLRRERGKTGPESRRTPRTEPGTPRQRKRTELGTLVARPSKTTTSRTQPGTVRKPETEREMVRTPESRKKPSCAHCLQKTEKPSNPEEFASSNEPKDAREDVLMPLPLLLTSGGCQQSLREDSRTRGDHWRLPKTLCSSRSVEHFVDGPRFPACAGELRSSLFIGSGMLMNR